MATGMLRVKLRQDFPNFIEYDPAFHQAVVDHFLYLRKMPHLLSSFTVNLLEGAVYRGDFHGLLTAKQVDPRFHYILTQFNGFNQSSDYTGSSGEFLKIDVEFLEKLKKTFQSRRQ